MAAYKGRKRRFSEDEEMSEASSPPPVQCARSFVEKHQQRMNEWKRSKTDSPKPSPLQDKLTMLDKDKLVQLVVTLLDTHPHLKQDLMKYIPAPTISSAIHALSELEKKIHTSFPYHKNGPRRDRYTYSRVRHTLQDLMDTMLLYCQHFVSMTMFPTTYFDFLDQVTYFAHRLPAWEVEEHNLPKQQLFEDLVDYWQQAIQLTVQLIQQAGTLSSFPIDTISHWAKSLAHHNALANGALQDAVSDFNQLLLLPSTLHHPSLPSLHPPVICHHPTPSNDILPSPGVVGYADLR
ncbi:nuclear envelope [Hesseltinella vesiculosa]|uniref:Tethering factor for nuclear proteasome STS1 n=1 Tax=Hesseltinella vesiculosa TaxID=101127 RepID=A0A1X2GWD4_9FUNG|nr:nuclear envelope [Hesseltinella vesiculosa]